MFGHFDGDLLVYRCGFAAERNEWAIGYDADADGVWGNVEIFRYKKEAMDRIHELFGERTSEEERSKWDIWSERVPEPVANALANVKNVIRVTLRDLALGPNDYRLYLTGSDNYREEVAVSRPYKGNRDENHKPVHGPAIKEYMLAHYNTVVAEGEEADDMVSYCHYGMYEDDPESSIIISVDKDLNMVPGWHYNFVKEDKYFVTEEQAEYAFWTQMITGDSVDNIPGLPRHGKQKAAKLLDGAGREHWPGIVKGLYQSVKGDDWEDYMLEQGRLLWMRREPFEMWEIPETEDEGEIEWETMSLV